jgi:hypothetical protein
MMMMRNDEKNGAGQHNAYDDDNIIDYYDLDICANAHDDCE